MFMGVTINMYYPRKDAIRFKTFKDIFFEYRWERQWNGRQGDGDHYYRPKLWFLLSLTVIVVTAAFRLH